MLDEDAFKGDEYSQQIKLLSQINKAASDPIIAQQIADANKYLQEFEDEIIQRTKNSLAENMQNQGILVAR